MDEGKKDKRIDCYALPKEWLPETEEVEDTAREDCVTESEPLDAKATLGAEAGAKSETSEKESRCRQFFRRSVINSYEVDGSKVARASGLIRELQEAAYHQMETQKPSYDDLLKEGRALMIARMDLDVLEEINLNDEIVTSSWPCPSSRATLLRCYAMWRGGRLIARASSQWVVADISSRKILKVDSLDFSRYFLGEYRDVCDRKLAISAEEQEGLELVGTKVVMYSDLDYNGHMNNTYYPDLLCDYIPELAAGTHRVRSIRLHYAKEAVLGDVLEIKRACPDAGKYLFQTVKTGNALRKPCDRSEAEKPQKSEVNLQAEILLTSLD